MTVSTAPTPLSYSTDGSPPSYAITWKYNAKSHVVATLRSSAGAETVWALTTNYTLTDPGDSGTLTPTVIPATGQTLVITLEPPNTQSSDIPLGGDFPSTTVEYGLDLSAQRDAKIEALFLRALRVPKTDTQTGSLLEIPIDSLRASKFLSFDANGKPIAAAGTSANLGPVSSFIDTLLDDTTAAAARTTLGSTTVGDAVFIAATAAAARTAITALEDANQTITSAKIIDAAVTPAQIKTKTAVALADADATLTAAQMVDSGIFTIAASAGRTLTTDTAVNIIAALPRYQVGTWFDILIINTGASFVDVVAGAGVTSVGTLRVSTLTSGVFKIRIDSSSTATSYRS